ncbi:hypothetical protein JYU10_00260 [bacterium AH-315-J04]|nr:hypothetical protein [bacterium AH-315-J04]
MNRYGVYASIFMAIVIGAFTFLSKRLISLVETSQNLTANIALSKAESHIRAFEAMRVEAITGTYARIVILQRCLLRYVAFLERSDAPSDDEKLENLCAANEDFNLFFFPKEIYFPKDIGDAIVDWYNNTHNCIRSWQNAERAMLHEHVKIAATQTENVEVLTASGKKLLEDLKDKLQKYTSPDQD